MTSARVTIQSATTAEARAFSRSLRASGLPAARMYGEGPEAWTCVSATEQDLPSAADPLAILKALAAARAADGAADDCLPSGQAAPIYLVLRPEAAADTRAALYASAWKAAECLKDGAAEIVANGGEVPKDLRLVEQHLATLRDVLANIPE